MDLLNQKNCGSRQHLGFFRVIGSFRRPPPYDQIEMQEAAYHGGRFWERLGSQCDKLDRRLGLVQADVLDAWFPPAPEILESLEGHEAWTWTASPPVDASGLEEVIAQNRSLPQKCVLAGPGSSALIFHAFRECLKPGSKVALLEPTYSEYEHVAGKLMGCQITRFVLDSEKGFQTSVDELARWLDNEQPDLFVLVNPNNPTGTTFAVEELVPHLPDKTALWVDEAYIDYTKAATAEDLAAESPKVWVVKSLSKAYGLSGLRAAYLTACPDWISHLRTWTPPWWVSLPAQVAACGIWRNQPYYRAKHKETAEMRLALEQSLTHEGFLVQASEANWVLAQCPWMTAAELCRLLSGRGVFVRDAGLTGPSLGDHSVRIAVRPDPERGQLMQALHSVHSFVKRNCLQTK